MIKKYDPLKASMRPLLAKTLQNALSHRIAKEFPRIGGPRICQLCAEMILEVVNNYIRPKEHVHHGQIVWIAVDRKQMGILTHMRQVRGQIVDKR